MKIVLVLLTISLGLQAKILEYKRQAPESSAHDLKKVCYSELGISTPLVGAPNMNQVDCMGKRVWARSYCDKISQADPYWIRGYVDKEDEKVICESARKVKIVYSCESDDGICMSADIGCGFLQDTFAKRLNIDYAAFRRNLDGQKVLDCYYGPKKLRDLSKL
jgi:hypothetical protein